MNCKSILEEIRKLNIPAQVKAELLILASQAKGLVLAIIRFIQRHRRFGEAMILGAIVAYLLGQIPLIGGFLAMCSLVTAAAIGLMRELREDLSQFFSEDVTAHA